MLKKMTVTIIVLMFLGLCACDSGKPKTATEKAKESIEHAVDETKEAMHDAGSATKEAAHDAARAAEEAAHDVDHDIKKAVE